MFINFVREIGILQLINFNIECIEEYINYYLFYIYYERISKLKEVIKKEDILIII